MDPRLTVRGASVKRSNEEFLILIFYCICQIKNSLIYTAMFPTRDVPSAVSRMMFEPGSLTWLFNFLCSSSNSALPPPPSSPLCRQRPLLLPDHRHARLPAHLAMLPDPSHRHAGVHPGAGRGRQRRQGAGLLRRHRPAAQPGRRLQPGKRSHCQSFPVSLAPSSASVHVPCYPGCGRGRHGNILTPRYQRRDHIVIKERKSENVCIQMKMKRGLIRS